MIQVPMRIQEEALGAGDLFAAVVNKRGVAASNGTLDMLIDLTSCTSCKQICVADFEAIAGQGKANFSAYFGTLYTGGTATVAVNRDFSSGHVSDALILKDPTITDIGIELVTNIIPDVRNTPGDAGGQQPTLEIKYINLPPAVYLLRYENLSVQPVDAEIQLAWIEGRKVYLQSTSS